MSNRRKLRRPVRPRRFEDRIGFARLFRETCSDCGSGLLVWDTAPDAMLVEPELVARLLPPGLPDEEVEDAVIWACQSCGEAGIMLGMEVG